MKKVFLIAEGEFGENLCELLILEGFDSKIVANLAKMAAGEVLVVPDLYICDTGSIHHKQKPSLVEFLRQHTCIVIGADGEPPHEWLDARHYLRIPFSDTDLLEAVKGCLGSHGEFTDPS